MSNKKYTVSEISKEFGDNPRQVQRKLKELINIDGGKYLIDESIVNMLYPATTDDYDVVEAFTKEEYAEFQKRLTEYQQLKKSLEFHKRSIESHQRQMEMMLRTISEKNHLEAESRGLIKNKNG